MLDSIFSDHLILGVYVPLRFINYLSAININTDYVQYLRFYDDDSSSFSKYYDGVPVPIGNLESLISEPPDHLLICTYNFSHAILAKIPQNILDKIKVHTIQDILNYSIDEVVG